MTLVKQLFSRRWLSGTLLVLFAMGVFARLGFWQLDRLAERRAANETLRAMLASSPLDLAETLPASPDELENRLATVTGTYDFAEERIVLLQNRQGRPGVLLVTPLLIDGLADTAVLVNRGWVPQAEYEAEQLAQYQVAVGTVQVTGFLALSQPPARNETVTIAPQEIYRIEIEPIDAALLYELLPIYLVESPEDGPDLEPPIRTEREVDLSEGPHQGYAYQWFIFCVLTGGLYLVFVRRSERERPSVPTNPL